MDCFWEENKRLRLSRIRKEQSLANSLACPTAAIELATLRETKIFVDNGRRVSDSAKVTALQETDVSVAAQKVPVREKDKSLATVLNEYL